MAIQDPYVWNDTPLSALGFSLIFPTISPTQKVHACFDISNAIVTKLNCSFLPLFYDRDDILGLTLFFPSSFFLLGKPALTVINIYNRNIASSSHSRHVHPSLIFQKFNHSVVVVRDYNIHHHAANPS